MLYLPGLILNIFGMIETTPNNYKVFTVALPQFKNVSAKSNRFVCTANIDTLNMALELYEQANPENLAIDFINELNSDKGIILPSPVNVCFVCPLAGEVLAAQVVRVRQFSHVTLSASCKYDVFLGLELVNACVTSAVDVLASIGSRALLESPAT